VDVDVLVVLEHERDRVGEQQAEDGEPQVEPRLPLAPESFPLLEYHVLVVSGRCCVLLPLVLHGEPV
jgi:hypothetical protein